MTEAGDRLRELSDGYVSVRDRRQFLIGSNMALREGARTDTDSFLSGMTPTERNAGRKACRRFADKLRALADELEGK